MIRRNFSIINSFIPRYERLVDIKFVEQLQSILDGIPKILVITGAGVSTESGIPDYRSEKVGRYATSKLRPVQYQEFVKSKECRQRYWARNFAGWKRFSSFEPNINHICLTNWELNNRLHWLITQNVDNLHRKAGSTRITELHGTAFRVKCMNCKTSFDRQTIQIYTEKLNPTWNVDAIGLAPDGDVDLSTDQIKTFIPLQCKKCDGDLIPDIVFFGDNVAKEKVEFCYDKTDTADGMLILGSSLQVFSGYRFVKRFSGRQKPIIIINIGETRADDLATFKISTKCGDILPLIKMGQERLYLPQ